MVTFTGIIDISLKNKPEGSSWTADTTPLSSGAPVMLFTAVMVITVSVFNAPAGTSSVRTVPSAVVSDMALPPRDNMELTVVVSSNSTVTFSGSAGALKSITGRSFG
jgi:hypothetical protein